MMTEKFRLDGKTALVSGTGRGIGHACALALSEAGADIVVIARTEDKLASLASEIETADGTARTLSLNITDSDATQEKIEAVSEIDVLINNAGTNRPQRQGGLSGRAGLRPENGGAGPGRHQHR